MHAVLARQLRRAGLSADAPPAGCDIDAWRSFLESISKAYAHSDEDRALLERSISVSSEEMRTLYTQLEAQNAVLAEARDAAEAASRAKTEFLANMSHEIRTPMTAILGYTELLVDPNLADQERANSIATIRRNASHLLSIIDDILDISKIEAQRLRAQPVPCSLVQVVEDVHSLMRVRSAAKGLALTVNYRWPLPEIITTDPVRCRQILVNLIGNAIKFTEKGGVTVNVECDVASRLVRIIVADTGIGIVPEHIDRIFQPFMQADETTTRRFGGTGLGLPISQRLAEMLGGQVVVESHPGRGSTFTLTIASGDIDESRMKTAIDESPRPSTHPAASPACAPLTGRILLAEDGPDNQRLISFHLRKAGAEVHIVGTGRLAVEAALASQGAGPPFDLILMDMQMPEMDGYTATRRLREAGYTGLIVALTAHAMSGDREQCLAAGCSDYLTKPIERGTLINACRNLLARRAAA